MVLSAIKTIRVDFDARTMSGLISLGIPDARKSIEEAGGIKLGETVLLTDGTLSVEALVISVNDILFAQPYWDTMKVR